MHTLIDSLSYRKPLNLNLKKKKTSKPPKLLYSCTVLVQTLKHINQMSFFDVINNIESPLKNGSQKEQIESNQGVQDQKSTNSKIKLTIYMKLDST